ncbi:MAG: class I tRNA ligase family protein [Polyangiaceae bacterium]
MSSDPSHPTGQPAPPPAGGYPPDAPDPNRYDHAEVEPRWQRYWDEHRTFRAERSPDPQRQKRYLLDMFPYPSGAGLHVGHPEGYTATDIVARFCRMRGMDVLHPMGWDAFGLPAEQHAIKTGTHPAVTTRDNVATFMRQLKMLGFSYDWAREVNTTDPGYVAGRSGSSSSCSSTTWPTRTRCASTGAPGWARCWPTRRWWTARATSAASRWSACHCGSGCCASPPTPIAWPRTSPPSTGRGHGHRPAPLDRALRGRRDPLPVSGLDGAMIEVFTTRPDTLMGATYVVLAPEHALVERITSRAAAEAVQAYVATATRKSDLDRTADAKQKTGVDTGAFAVHPISGERLPIWVADYVLGGYGTGAVMAVPAHDERDFAFARCTACRWSRWSAPTASRTPRSARRSSTTG